MKKIAWILIIILVVIALSTVIVSIAASLLCPENLRSPDAMKQVAKQGVTDFLKNPSKSKLSQDEARDIADYAKINQGNNNIFCNVMGGNSGSTIINIIKKLNASVNVSEVDTSLIREDYCPGGCMIGEVCKLGGCIGINASGDQTCVPNSECNNGFKCTDTIFKQDSGCCMQIQAEWRGNICKISHTTPQFTP